MRTRAKAGTLAMVVRPKLGSNLRLGVQGLCLVLVFWLVSDLIQNRLLPPLQR